MYKNSFRYILLTCVNVSLEYLIGCLCKFSTCVALAFICLRHGGEFCLYIERCDVMFEEFYGGRE